MKTINLHDRLAQQELLDMPLGEVFFFNQSTRGGKLTVLGKFDEGGEFRMEGHCFLKDGQLTHDEVDEDYCQYWIQVALGDKVEQGEDNEVDDDYECASYQGHLSNCELDGMYDAKGAQQ